MKKILLFCTVLLLAVMNLTTSTLLAQQNNLSDGAVIGNFSDAAAATAIEASSTAGQSAAGAPGPEDDEDEDKDKDRENVIQGVPDQSEDGAFGPLDEDGSGVGAEPRG